MVRNSIFFGSIGVLAETSELQRQAYNTALKLNGINWQWNIGTYCGLLQKPGGQKRLSSFIGSDLDYEQIIKGFQKESNEILAGVQTIL